MSNYHRQYYTEVEWIGRPPSMETISVALLPIRFSIYMPHQDPKLFESETSSLLTLHRDELPLMLYCLGATALKTIGDRVEQLLKEGLFSQVWSELKKYHSGNERLEFTKKRIMKVLESLMPLAQEKHRDVVAKIFNVLATMPEDAFVINVNIYIVTCNPNPKPATMSAMGNELEKVRLDRSCGICMDEFEKGVTAIRLPCLHMFHGTCIFRWLEKNHNCPLCRHPMPHDESSYEPDVTVYQHSYYTEIESKTCTPSPTSILQIRFSLYKSNKSCSLMWDGKVLHTSTPDDEQIHLETEPQLLTIPSRCELQPTMITQVLRSMSVPRHEQPPIVAKIFETVADGDGALINANIYHEALKLFDFRAYDRWFFRFRIRWFGIDGPITNEIDARVARELAEEESYGKARPKPATKSAIEGLERVRVDTSCGICMHDFEDGLMATRFPCLHIFHGDCILRWLETHYKCPLCRYPLLCDQRRSQNSKTTWSRLLLTKISKYIK